MSATMDLDKAKRQGDLFRALHEGPGILVLPNPWDIGTAKIFANVGFQALATTSAGLAFSLGRRDGDAAVTREETLAHVHTIIEATSLPVSADLENGFGQEPEEVAETIRQAGLIGLVGASIEDATFDPENPIIERSLAVERIHAAVEAARNLPYTFTLTARAENFIRGRPNLDDTLWRLQAFEVAGANVLYAPGLPDEAALRHVCGALRKPFNYVAGIGPARYSIKQLSEIGVRRVTIGTSFARAALTAALGAAREVFSQGTFEYTDGIYSVAEFNELIEARDR